MNNISKSIYHYYQAHFDELSLSKQFHFASRLDVWSEDAWAHEKVEQLRKQLLPTGEGAETLRRISDGTLIPLRYGSKGLQALRGPYFARYPKLRTYAAMLYWALQLEHFYGIDARRAVVANVADGELDQLYSDIMNDREAIAALSTYAINFLYLYRRLFHHDAADLSPLLFEEIAASVHNRNDSDPRQLQLRLYLLTHCIIADSLFYIRKLPSAHYTDYRHLLEILESTTEQHYATVALDNKFEFLICCRLIGYTSELEEKIIAEASRSFSPHGTFLIDTENTNRISGSTSLGNSEHRNVLYILTQRQYKG